MLGFDIHAMLLSPQEEPLKSNDLKHCQAARVNESLRQTVAYLGRLKRRMEKRRFPPDDWSLRHRLSMELHYLSCKSGVGRKAK